MKLLHIITTVDLRGGGPIEGIRQRGQYLCQHGHSVEVLSLDAPTSPWVSRFELPVHAVGPSRGGYAYAPAIKAWLRAHARDYDHIIINGLWQYHGQAAARTLQDMGVPYNVFTHGMLDPWFREAFPLKHLKKSLYWLLAEGQVLSGAQRVFFTSEEERLRARGAFWPYRVREVVVPYGTRTPPPAQPAHLEALYTAHPQLRGQHLLLFLSRVHVKKGCDLLLEAFGALAAAHPNVHLVMAGPGAPEVLEPLKQQAERLGLAARITWIGMVQGDAKWALFHAADAFVLPSHQENFGISVAEALGCGTPVLISDKVNIWREIVADGAGFVGPDTTDGTYSCLKQWLTLTPDRQRAMSEAAQACFLARYTVESMANGLLSALSTPGSGGPPLPMASPGSDTAHKAPAPRRQPVEQGGESVIRVLHVVGSVDPATGGVAESIRARGLRLRELGHTVEVLCLDAPGSPAVQGYPLPLHVLGPGVTRWSYTPGLVPWLRANRHRFDAVVVDGIWQYHGLAVRRALQGSGVPYFVFTHGMLDPWFRHTYPLKHAKKWLVWPWADYRVLRDAKAVLFTCEEEQLLAAQSFSLYRVRPQVVPFGTATPPPDGARLRATFLAAFPQLQGRKTLLFLGRIHEKKGCDLLVQAFGQLAQDHPEHDLAIAGPGDPALVHQLKALATQAGIADRVHWLGMLTGEQKWGALYASTAFVLPSHQENFGIAVVEALGCGIPVLISNKVNIWREVAAGGGLVEPDDLPGTTRGLQRLMTLTPPEHSDLARRARATFEQHFTVDAMAQGLVDAVRG